jgi:predicted RNA methylase
MCEHDQEKTMKTKKYSLAYWVKQHTRFVSQPENVLLDAINTYVECGEHPTLSFTGSALELANALYIEWRKKPGAYPGLFPTPLDLALRAARLLNLQPGQTVLDGGSGFGNLSWAVRECGGAPVGVEVQPWVRQVNQALGLGAELGDLLDGYTPPPFDAAILNPPFGKVYGSTDATLDFMTRIADLSRPGTLVAAILPVSYMTVANPKKTQAAMMARYEVLSEEHLPATTFRPLTNVATTLYLLRVTDGQTPAISPGKGAQRKVGSAHQEDVIAQPTTEELLDIVEAKDREVTESLAALRTSGESHTGTERRNVSRPRLSDGRPRATLPDELVEICERQHVLDYRLIRPNSDQPAFEDDELMLRGTRLDAGQWRWDALYFHNSAVLEIALWRDGDTHETISGPNAIAALAALKSHLRAWGVNADIQLAPDPLPSGCAGYSVPRAPIPHDLYRRRAAHYVLSHNPELQARYEQWEDSGIRLIKMMDGAWWAYYLDPDNQELPIPWGRMPDGQDIPLTADTAKECAALLETHFAAWGCPTEILFEGCVQAQPDVPMPQVPTPVETPAKPSGKGLPDGIPETVEVDVGGRTARWERAQVMGVVSGKLVCQLAGGQQVKTPVCGKGISWRTQLAA